MHSTVAGALGALPAFPVPACAASHKELVYEHHGPNGLEGTLRIVPTRANRPFALGLDLVPHRPLVLLGFSLGNGYFTRKRIEIATCGFAALVGDLALVVPDTIATHTYRAIGYDDAQSRSKAKEQGKALKNRSRAAMVRARQAGLASQMDLIDWDRDVSSLPAFPAAYARVCALFDQNETFRREVLAKVGEVVTGKTGQTSHHPASLREGAEYLLKEFAYISVCQGWFGRNVVLPYYQSFDLLQNFCAGVYGDPVPGVGNLVYEIEIFDAPQAD